MGSRWFPGCSDVLSRIRPVQERTHEPCCACSFHRYLLCFQLTTHCPEQRPCKSGRLCQTCAEYPGERLAAERSYCRFFPEENVRLESGAEFQGGRDKAVGGIGYRAGDGGVQYAAGSAAGATLHHI